MGKVTTAKLTAQDVHDIRVSKSTTRQLAERFGVGRSTICRILTNQAWPDHPTPAPRAHPPCAECQRYGAIGGEPLCRLCRREVRRALSRITAKQCECGAFIEPRRTYCRTCGPKHRREYQRVQEKQRRRRFADRGECHICHRDIEDHRRLFLDPPRMTCAQCTRDTYRKYGASQGLWQGYCVVCGGLGHYYQTCPLREELLAGEVVTDATAADDTGRSARSSTPRES